MNKNMISDLIKLHLLLFLYSCGAICSKLAAGAEILSMGFVLCYGGLILILGIYAVFWQKLIARLPLSLAFSNKSVTLIWGILLGALLFGEKITFQKLAGAALVIAGVILFVSAEEKHE